MDFSVPISVVMSNYNTEVSMLREAVESILSQTFCDFEFIIIDDGSTDESVDYLRGLPDPRIRLIRNPVNIGLTKSLNIGLKVAKGKYIARMDADDIALPVRFEKQYAYMEAHPDVILCGSRALCFNGDLSHPAGTTRRAPENMEEYRVHLLFRNPGPNHPTAFFRHESLLEHHVLYDESLIYAQDYGMWETISRVGRIYVLPDILLYYRQHEKQISIEHKEKQLECDKAVKRRQIAALLGSVTEEELDRHFDCAFHKVVMSPEVSDWYRRLLRANKEKRIYNQRELYRRIQKIKIKLVYRTIHTQNLSGVEKTRIICRYIPIIVMPEAVIKFGIWSIDG
jgi:glycosyltransferase involved in cell wall biosynthesis